MKSRDFSLFLCLLSIIAGVTVRVRGQQSGVQPEVARGVGALPMVFEPNLGQAAADAQFLSRYGEHTLLLTPREAILVLPLVSSLSQQSNRILRIKLVGMQLHPRMYGFDELPGKSNYFIGKDAANWRTNIPQYARVKYKSVYRGIDLVFYGIEGELEYDFQVAVGADPKVIDLRIEGTDQMHVDGSGNLLLRFDGVTVRLKKPNVYQDVGGDRREIACIFDLRGKNHVGFKLDDYDRSLPLVIDPVLSYG